MSRTKKKASEPEGPEAVIPVISLVALLYSDAETVSGGTRQHQNASSEASSHYSHSIVKNSLQFVPVCRCLFRFGLFTPGLKNCLESMGSNLGHGYSGIRGDFVGHGGSRKPLLIFESRQEDKCGQSLLAINHELLRCRVVLLVEVNRGLLVLLVLGAPPKECSSRWDSCVAWNREISDVEIPSYKGSLQIGQSNTTLYDITEELADRSIDSGK